MHVSEDAQPQQCENRYYRTLDPTLSRGSWTTTEDEQLRSATAALGTQAWSAIAEFVPGRSNEQCRDRWQSALNPILAKGKWSQEEDDMLLETISELGTTNWKAVSEALGTGRTDSQVSLKAT